MRWKTQTVANGDPTGKNRDFKIGLDLITLMLALFAPLWAAQWAAAERDGDIRREAAVTSQRVVNIENHMVDKEAFVTAFVNRDMAFIKLQDQVDYLTAAQDVAIKKADETLDQTAHVLGVVEKLPHNGNGKKKP